MKNKKTDESKLQYHKDHHLTPIHEHCEFCKREMIAPDRDIATASKEELLKWYLEARDIQGVMEATKKLVGERLCELIPDNGAEIDNFLVSKTELITFPGIKMEQAEELGATKMEKKVDLDVLKMLHKKGIKVPNVKITVYPRVTDITKEGNEPKSKAK